MGRSNKDAWLTGPGDLREADVEDVPVKGQSVHVRGLAAGFTNEAQSEATEMKQVGLDQYVTVNKARLEVLQFAHGVIDPQFTVEEAEVVSKKFGPAFRKVIAKIDELSGLDKEAIDEATARFPASGEGKERGAVGNGTGSGDGRSSVPARASARVGKDGPGDDVG